MTMIIGFLTVFLTVHLIIGINTNYTSFYWIGKLFIEAEAIQNSAIRSMPAWFQTWKDNYQQERSELKGIQHV